MPRQYTKSNSKKQVTRATEKLIRQSQIQARQDLVNQWRFLRKIGAYETKETAAQIRLTDSRIRAIKKKMKEINSLKKFKRGRVISPVQLYDYTTKSGKRKLKYDFNPSFTLVKTKNKPIITEGIKKVGKKSYVVETTSFGSKINIDKKGRVIEVKGRTRRIRTRFKGKDLFTFLEKVDQGKVKFKKHDMVIFHRWGQPNSTLTFGRDDVSLLSRYLETTRQTMDNETFNRFVAVSYVEIVQDRSED